MLPTDPIIYLIPLALISLFASLIQIKIYEQEIKKKKKIIDQRVYETEVLAQISQKIGYDLNLEKVLDIIIDSLNNFLPYSVCAVMIVSPDQTKTNIKFHLEDAVGGEFLEDMKKHMMNSLNTIVDKPIVINNVNEVFSGKSVHDNDHSKVSSLWLAPLCLNKRDFGVLAVGYKKVGFYKNGEMEVFNNILSIACQAVENVEKLLSSEEEKLTSMVGSMSDGVMMLNDKLDLVVINQSAQKLLGLPEDDKTTIFDVMTKLADRFDLRTKVEESIQNDKLVACEDLTINNRFVQILISAVKNLQGKMLGALVLFHDVTAQKELERVRNEFTAMMVHELRAPLTVVRGAMDMFIRNPSVAVSDQGQDLLKTVQTSATTMLSLVSDLLDASKIEAGKFQILKTPGNLAELVKDRVTFFTQMAAPKSIEIVNNTNFSDVGLAFDRERILQVLNNLLSNAIKFTPMGGKVVISGYKINSPNDVLWNISSDRPNISRLKCPALLVCVSDTGRGLSADEIANLFYKYKQLQPSNEENKGTGLGLVIAKGIVESHGGEIFVQSKVYEGSSFYFTLPLGVDT